MLDPSAWGGACQQALDRGTDGAACATAGMGWPWQLVVTGEGGQVHDQLRPAPGSRTGSTHRSAMEVGVHPATDFLNEKPDISAVRPYAMPDSSTIPEGVAPWRLDPQRAALLIHDMQRYFLAPFPHDASPVVELTANTAKIRQSCASAGIPVAYTAQPGAMSPAERGLLFDFWGSGMTDSARDRGFASRLSPTSRDAVFTKWRYSAFHRTRLLDFLRSHGRDQLIVCGVYAHIGCLMTAQDAFAHDIQPFLVADAVADFSLPHHLLALGYATARCAATPTTSSVVACLG